MISKGIESGQFMSFLQCDQASIGTFLFTLSLIGAIINIPCFYSLPSDSIILKMTWRYLILIIMLIPKIFFDVAAIGDRIYEILNPSNLFYLLFLAFLNTIWVYLFYLAASHTFSAHTMLLQLPMLFLTLWKLLRRELLTYLELIGIGITVFGAYLITNDGETLDRKDILIGNLISIGSSIIGAIYIYLSQPIVNKSIPASIYLGITGIGLIIFSFLFASFLGEKISFASTDSNNGVFGIFATTENLIYGFIGLGVMSGFTLTYFPIKASEYISPMFMNTTFNCAPFLSQLVCYVLGVQGFPGNFTAFGGFWLFIGCTLLTMSYEDHNDLAKKFPVSGVIFNSKIVEKSSHQEKV